MSLNRTLTALCYQSTFQQLAIEHILQRDRDVWTIHAETPYLRIQDGEVRERAASLGEFPVYSSGILFQNLARADMGRIMVNALLGSGTSAGVTRDSRIVVEGRSNKMARAIWNANEPILRGGHAFAASGWQMIYVKGDEIYQWKIGNLINGPTGNSRPSSPVFDFDPISDITDLYFSHYRYGKTLTTDQERELTEAFDRLFVLNGASLAAAAEYHHKTPVPVTLDYEPPVLSKFERPTHDENGLPQIETAYALIHYEKALIEFEALKKSEADSRRDAFMLHGVYCMLAIAACLEAVANKMILQVTGQHPPTDDRRKPLAKLNDAGVEMAKRHAIAFTPIDETAAAPALLERIRRSRNKFMHAKEKASPVHSATRRAESAMALSSEECRAGLKALREVVGQVYDQFDKLAAPIVTNPKVRWLSDVEIP